MFWFILFLLGKSQTEDEILEAQIDELNSKRDYLKLELAKIHAVYYNFGDTTKLDRDIQILEDLIDCYTIALKMLKTEYATYLINTLRQSK